jgi:hypothetical protein
MIVTAVQLRGINGIELCRLLRHDVLTRHIPIIVVAGDAVGNHAKLVAATGADAVLVHPCLPERLATEIGRVLAASTALSVNASTSLNDAGGHREPSRELSNPLPPSVRRTILSRAYKRRDTTEPPASPPAISCPACERPLRYVQSHIGGVSERHAEQWDNFECSSCGGLFEYRQRTGKMRASPSSESRFRRLRS